jgi:hypothetical protein
MNDDTGRFFKNILEQQVPLIFLSYAKEDSSRVRAIYRRLRTEHLNPWLDVADLLPGQEWESAIVSAIRSARFVIVFLSNHSVSKRGYVQKEIREALDAADRVPEGDIYIIPVRLEECPVPERLAKLQWVDVFRHKGLSKLVRALKNNFDGEDVADPDLKANLVVMGTNDHMATFQLQKPVTLVGRRAPNATVIPDIDLSRFDRRRMISRKHAYIIRVGNSFVIKDCGSSNGTIVNDSILLESQQTRILKVGDKICLGETTVFFVTYH